MKEFTFYFNPGDNLVVKTAAAGALHYGAFKAIDENFIYLQSEITGSIRALSLRNVVEIYQKSDFLASHEDKSLSPMAPAMESYGVELEQAEVKDVAPSDKMPFDDHYDTEEIPPVNLKIVGKIDLDSIRERKAKAMSRLDDSRPRLSVDPERYAELCALWMPVAGRIKQTGPKFGFITDKDGSDIYFNMGRAPLEPVHVGQDVIFSCFDGAVGRQANAIHGVKNVAQMLHMICRQNPISGKGQRVIADLASQLEEAFSDNEVVMEELDNIREKIESIVKARNEADRNSPKIVYYLSRIADSWLPERYDDFVAECISLLDEAKNGEYETERRRIYDIYAHLIKNAKGDDRETYANEAANYFSTMGEWKKSQYFRRLADRSNSYNYGYNNYGYSRYGYSNDSEVGHSDYDSPEVGNLLGDDMSGLTD